MLHSATYHMREAAVAEAMRELCETWSFSAEEKEHMKEKLRLLWDVGLQRGVAIADPDWERDLIG